MFPPQTVVFLVALFLWNNYPAFGQLVLYQQNFDGGTPPALPADWSATSPQIFTNLPGSGTQSSGYSSASGGVNLAARNCLPIGELRQFQVDGISTQDGYGLILRFGHRRTASFTPAVALEWSADGGNNWQALPYNSATATSTWSLYTSPPLPMGTQNQPSLALRWSYITQGGNIACEDFAGAYRIDDVLLTAAVLPVELTGFSVSPENNGARLEWQTASENSNAWFIVERSGQELAFGEIGRIAGSEHSVVPRQYRFSDDHPPPGRAYYRLRQVDLDGHFTFGPVVAVMVGKPGSFRLHPSPVQDRMYVQTEAAEEEAWLWQIHDQWGRQLHSGSFETTKGENAVDVGALPVGVYVLRLSNGAIVQSRQFVKQ